MRWCWSGGCVLGRGVLWGDGDGQAESFELVEAALFSRGIAAAGEVVGAEILEGGGGGGEEVPGDDEDGMSDGDGRFALAAAAGDLAPLGAEIGVGDAG